MVRSTRLFVAAGLVMLLLATTVSAQTLKSPMTGNPQIKSIEAISFGPNGLLLIGGGAQVVAVETGDTKATKWSTPEIANVDQVLAGKLGLSAKDIEIRDLAVNPASMKAYVALKSLKTNDSVILTVDGAGTVAELPLSNVKYNSYTLAVPKLGVPKLADLAWANGKIVASTQAGDKFNASSRVFTINPAAKDGAATQVSTKTYHTGHGKWETHAPLKALMTIVEGGKTSVIGSFTCTPIVKYNLDSANTEGQVTGTTSVELGQGNTPRSMFAYERGGKKYLLVSVGRNNKKPAFGFPSAYWVARVDAGLLDETMNINEKAPWRDGTAKGGAPQVGDRVEVAKEYFGTMQLDRLDATRALAIIETKGALSLRALPLP